jgi:hypothetical protein
VQEQDFAEPTQGHRGFGGMQICCPGSVSGINNVQFRENIFLLEEAGRQGVDEYFFRTKIENMYKNVFLMHGW